MLLYSLIIKKVTVDAKRKGYAIKIDGIWNNRKVFLVFAGMEIENTSIIFKNEEIKNALKEKLYLIFGDVPFNQKEINEIVGRTRIIDF